MEKIDSVDDKEPYFGYISGELSLVDKIKVVDLYNKGIIRILIYTLSIKEGISFKETNNIIVFQPHWNFAIMNQIIERGIRFDSHEKKSKDLINLYMLCAVKHESNFLDWKKDVEKVFNDNLETLELPVKKGTINKNKEEIELSIAEGYTRKYSHLPFSRDVDIYNRFIDKQGIINDFKKKLEKVNTFEFSTK